MIRPPDSPAEWLVRNAAPLCAGVAFLSVVLSMLANLADAPLPILLLLNVATAAGLAGALWGPQWLAMAPRGEASDLVPIALPALVQQALPWSLILVMAVGNAAGALFLNTSLDSDLFGATLFVCLGAFHAEAGLIGLWFSLGPVPWSVRIPQCGLAIYVAWLAWFAGMGPGGVPPTEITIVCGAILLGTAMLTAVSAWLYVRIVRGQELDGARNPADAQFSMRTLLIWMVVSAVASVITRGVMNLADETSGGGGPGAAVLTGICLATGTFGAAISVAAAVFALNRRPTSAHAAALAACCIGPPVFGGSVLLIAGSPGPTMWRYWGAIACYTLGLLATSTAVMFAMRQLGYHLRPQVMQPSGAAATTDPSRPSSPLDEPMTPIS